MIGKILDIRKNLSKATFVCPKSIWEVWGESRRQEIFAISSTETDTKLLYKYEHLFFLKTGVSIINFPPSPLSFLQTYCA